MELLASKQEIDTDIILIDIISFSTFNNTQQFYFIKYFTNFFKKIIDTILSKSKTRKKNKDDILGFIPTGDGFFIILSPELKGYGLILALSLKNVTSKLYEKFDYFQGVKIAVNNGIALKFKDILGHPNFIGDGLNNCARYLSYKSKDIEEYFSDGYVIISESTWKEFKRFLLNDEQMRRLIMKLGLNASEKIEFSDKHNYIHKGYVVWTNEEIIIAP